MAAPFYPRTCHPIGRRTFLAATLGTAGALAAGLPSRAEAGTLDESKRLIVTRARRRDDPWAIVHAVRALGPSLTLDGGQPAVPFVLSEYLEERTVNGATYLAFPLRVEIHENSFLKTFLEAGVPVDLRFSLKGHARTLDDVVTGARALFRFSGATSRNTIAWSLIALSRTNPPARGSWRNGWGEPVDLGRVAEAGLEALEQASQPIAAARDRGQAVERQAPVHAFTCGGTHLLYGLLAATQAGYGGSRVRDRIRRQMDLLVYRLWADVDLMTRFYQPKLAGAPQAAWFLLDGRLKFIGHAFECLGFAERHGLYGLGAEQAARKEDAKRVLEADIERLGGMDLDAIRRGIPELYQQLLGDLCHAHHGLTSS